MLVILSVANAMLVILSVANAVSGVEGRALLLRGASLDFAPSARRSG